MKDCLNLGFYPLAPGQLKGVSEQKCAQHWPGIQPHQWEHIAQMWALTASLRIPGLGAREQKLEVSLCSTPLSCLLLGPLLQPSGLSGTGQVGED